MRLNITGIDALARKLATDLAPAIQAGAMGIAAAIQDDLAPYPAPPPKSTYRRGKDPRSEMLNRRWNIRGIPLGAVLENRASYSRWVHGSPKERPGQTRRHQQTGWTNEDTAKQQVLRSGQARRLMERAIWDRLGMVR